MMRCLDCDTSGTCRIPEELSRLARVQKVIGERGGNPWLEARIEQYMAVDVCLSSLFGLDELHQKAINAEAGTEAASGARIWGGQPSCRHIPNQSIALELILQRLQTAAA